MRKIFFLLIVLSCVSVFSANYVLLIGNSSYFFDQGVKNISSESMILNLKNAILQSGYTDEEYIKVLLDSSKENIINTINELAKKATADDSIFLYYCGFRMKADNLYYYSTSDSQVILLKEKPLTENSIKDTLFQTPAKINILIDSFETGQNIKEPVIKYEITSGKYLIVLSVSEPENTMTNKLIISSFTDKKNSHELLTGFKKNQDKEFMPKIINPVQDIKYGRSTKLEWITNPTGNEKLKYDIYFGTDKNPPLYVSNYATPSYNLPSWSLNFDTDYYLKISAKDSSGNIYTSDTVNFETVKDISVLKVCIGYVAPFTGIAAASYLYPYVKDPVLQTIFGLSIIFGTPLSITLMSAFNGENTNILITTAGYFLGAIATNVVLCIPGLLLISTGVSGTVVYAGCVLLGATIGATWLSSF